MQSSVRQRIGRLLVESPGSRVPLAWRPWAVLSSVLLVACARGLNDRAPPTDQLLSATGFQMRYADTPRKLAELERMTQRRPVPESGS